MSANLEGDAEISKSWHPYLKSYFAHRCFAHRGVDFSGPFVIKLTRKMTAKIYLCLFTCVSTRAVHLEVAYSLDTDIFLYAFSRMAARRGKPELMISDNGTNFTSAERELRYLVPTLDQTRIDPVLRFSPHIKNKYLI